VRVGRPAEEKLAVEEKSTEKPHSMAAVIEAMPIGVIVMDLEGRVLQGNEASRKMFEVKKGEGIGKLVTDYIVEEDVPRALESIQEGLRKGYYREFESTCITKAGRKFPILTDGILMRDTEGNPSSIILTFRDITKLKRAEEERVRAAADRARAEEMEKKVQKMRLIYEGSRKMALTLELDEIYNRALELACTALEADGGSVMTLDEKTGELVVKAASGSQKEIAIGKRLKLGERFAGHAAQMRSALFMHDVEDEPWFKSLKKFEGIKSGMSIPLLVKEKLVGVLNLKRTQRDEKFAKSDVGLVSILADYVASIIERKRAEEELKARVKELEEFHELTVGRELKMKQMEAELERLKAKLGEK